MGAPAISDAGSQRRPGAFRTIGVAAAALLSVLVLTAGTWYVTLIVPYMAETNQLGVDHRNLVQAADRWLAGGPFYAPYQLDGPYIIGDNDLSPILYPPPWLLLLVPFTVLPGLLWWLVPIAITGVVVVYHRPKPIVWPVLALLIAFPQTLWNAAAGNTSMWVTAAVAVGTVTGPWALLAALKPSLLAPFALIGVWRRSWWIGLVILVGVCALFLPLWMDYVVVLRNTLAGNDAAYGINQLLAVMIPVVAWLGSSRGLHIEWFRSSSR